jgi:polysaccharide chain length determinant protein (PEP-CTERM system associated)
MQELLEQIIEQVRGSWRFRRYALIAAWLIALAGWALVFVLPDMYQASSRVFVDTKTALKPVLQGLTLDQDVNAQLNLVRQSLLAQPQLEPVAQEIGLIDKRTMSPQQVLRALNAMRARVELGVSSAGESGDREAGSIYSISYRDTSRDRALKVVEILQTNLIENTLGGKREGSENAQKFLETQIRELEDRLRASEDRLASFKKSNVGLMPTETQQGGYFQRLQLEMDAVTQKQNALAVATSRRDELARQLRGEVPVTATGITTGPQQGSGPPGASGGDTLSRIKETQARLDELLLRFTDKHPDVIATRENLEQLKQRRAAEVEALKRGDPGAVAASGVSANPVYQSIQLALNQTDVEIASLRRELAGHQAKVAELRNMLDTMPQVEAEYARLNRDYDVTKASYTALVERLEKSRLGEEASTSGSVRFDVIEPPNAAFTPISPKRSLLILGVLVVALGIGGGIAYLLHMLRPVFTSVKGLAEATGLVVLGSVSMAWVEHQTHARRNSYLRYAVAFAGLIVIGAVVLQLSRMGIRLPMKGA